jgi:SepF-like predicted cell division protein (DUF552 family)
MPDEIKPSQEENKDHMIFGPQGQPMSENIEENVVIHTMPKKYLVSQPAAKKAKSLGFVILIGGAVFLIAGFAFMYYFIKDGKIGLPTEEEITTVDVADVSPPKKATGTKSTLTDVKKINDEAEAGNSLIDDLDTLAATTADENISAEIKNVDLTATGTAINKSDTTAPAAVKFVTAIDSDADGLTDSEELLINTNLNSQDTDGDGFTDLGEFFNMYNPAGAGKLIINPGIEKYTNSLFKYSLYYIKSWPVETVGGDDSVVFKLDNNQFIQIVVDTNSGQATLEKWYKDKMSLDYINPSQYIVKENWEGLKNEDGLTYYLKKSGNDKIYVLSYNLGTSNTLNFKGLFEMMIKSFDTAN